MLPTAEGRSSLLDPTLQSRAFSAAQNAERPENARWKEPRDPNEGRQKTPKPCSRTLIFFGSWRSTAAARLAGRSPRFAYMNDNVTPHDATSRGGRRLRLFPDHRTGRRPLRYPRSDRKEPIVLRAQERRGPCYLEPKLTRRSCDKSLILLVAEAGLEPATFGL
jgi:hypothetical protein